MPFIPKITIEIQNQGLFTKQPEPLVGGHCAQAARSRWVWLETRDGQESWRVGEAAGEYPPGGAGAARVWTGRANRCCGSESSPLPALRAQGRMCCRTSTGNADCAVPPGLIYERLLQRLFTHCISGPPRTPLEPAPAPAAASAASFCGPPASAPPPLPRPPPPSLCPGNLIAAALEPGDPTFWLCLPQPALLRQSQTRGCSSEFTRGPLLLRETTRAKNRDVEAARRPDRRGLAVSAELSLLIMKGLAWIPARDHALRPSAWSP